MRSPDAVATRFPTLLLDGAPAPAALAQAAVSIEVRQVLNAPALALLVFMDMAGSWSALLRLGAAVAVDAPDGTRLIDAEITTIDHVLEAGSARTIRIHAYDRLHRLRKRQQVRAFSDTDLGGLMAAIAADHGLAADAPSPAAPARSRIVQHDQSDFDFLAEQAAREGRYLQIVDGAIRAPTLAGDGGAPCVLKAGANLFAATASSTSEALRQQTAVEGWDWRRIAPVPGLAVLARQDELEIGADPGLGGGDLGWRILVNRLSAGPEEADAVAQADMDRAAALSATLTGTADGDAVLRPGRVVRVEGVSDVADRRYVLTEARHLFAAGSGYTTEIGTRPPPRAERPREAAVTIASVIDTADPESLARVRCTLTAIGRIETDWMPVLSVGAGAQKGVSIMPEPGDDVLVLLPDGDPARGIVLGGLYGTRIAPGERPVVGARGFALRTPGGQMLSLSSQDNHIRLETSGGDILEFAPGSSRLSVTRDLTIEAPGRKLTIRADAINFERG